MMRLISARLLFAFAVKSPAIWRRARNVSALGLLCLFGGMTSVQGQEVPTYPDKSRLLVYRDAGGKDQPIRTAADWAKRRAHILGNMERVMGPLPDKAKKTPLDVKIDEEVKTPKYTRKLLTYAASPGNRVPAYLLMPHERAGKLPAVLCLHGTQLQLGAKVAVGLGPKQDRGYAHHLAERGYVTIAPFYPKMGGYDFDAYANGFASATMLGIWNHMRAVDLLQSLPEVDGERIGVIGHSLGGHNSMFVAAFDERIRCIVSNCGFCSFPTYMKGNLKGWASEHYMPRLKSQFDLNPAKIPFDFPEVVAALAPRAFLASAPLRDHNFDLDGAKDCVKAALPVYELLGAKDKLKGYYPDCDHNFPDEVRAEAYGWLDRWLKR